MFIIHANKEDKNVNKIKDKIKYLSAIKQKYVHYVIFIKLIKGPKIT